MQWMATGESGKLITVVSRAVQGRDWWYGDYYGRGEGTVTRFDYFGEVHVK